jgi:DNA primase catalytic subunit
MANQATLIQEARISAYYQQLMPFESLVSWWTQENTVPLDEYELALFKGADFTPVQRHGHFTSAAELRDAVLRRRADRLDVGQRKPHGEDTYACQYVAFDLDLDDYPLLAGLTSSQDGNGDNDDDTAEFVHPQVAMTRLQWRGLVMSVCVLDYYLRHVLLAEPNALRYQSVAVFSGRRGFHLWLPNRMRDALTESAVLQLVEAIDKLHTRQGAVEALEALALSKDDENREIVLNLLADVAVTLLCNETFWRADSTLPVRQAFLDDLSAAWGSPVQPTAECFVAMAEPSDTLMTDVSQSMFDAALAPQPIYRRSFWALAGLLIIAPRLDRNVTLGNNHLLKCPFSLHSKTLLPSVPVDIRPSHVHVLMDQPRQECLITLGQLFDSVQAQQIKARLKFAQTVALFEECIVNQ